jgi:hypothetical protein
MNLGDVMDEIGTAVGSIDGMRVFPYSADRVTPPAALVVWPDEITYDTAMSRGGDRYTLPLWVVVGKADARTTRDRLSQYIDGAGDASVKSVVDGGTYTACDSIRVMSATVESVEIAGVNYLAANFQLDVIGTGG